MGTGHLSRCQVICIFCGHYVPTKLNMSKIINPTFELTIFIEIIITFLLSRKVCSHQKHRTRVWREEVLFLSPFCLFSCPPGFYMPTTDWTDYQNLFIPSTATFTFLLEPFKSSAAACHQDLYQQTQPWNSSPILFERICFGKLVSLTKLMSALYI